MKRSIFAFLVLLGALVISIAFPLIYNHYSSKTPPLVGDVQVGNAVESAVNQVFNPTFLTVSEALSFYQFTVDEHKEDSVFMSIPIDVVKTITTVLIGRTGQATKKSIVDEYQANYSETYKFIRTTDPVKSQQTSDTIRLPSTTTDDTVINGKHFQLIKETKINGNE